MNIIEITSEFERIAERIAEKKIERTLLKKRIKERIDKETALKQRLSDSKQARIVLQEVAKQTQQNLEFHLSNLVTMALHSINPEWPKFVALITIRRNKTECDLLFEEEGVRSKPLDCATGGPLDVASFALRISFWCLKRNRPSFILDEPFRNVSPDLQKKTSNMVKKISEEVGIQILMISHQENVSISADKVFLNTKKGGISRTEEIN